MLPIIEIPATVLGILICVVFIHFSAITTSSNFFYDLIFCLYNFIGLDFDSFSTFIFFHFYPTRLFLVASGIVEMGFTGSTNIIASFIYWYVYLFIIDYYSLVWFKRTPSMMLTGEFLVDDEGYQISKRQYFVRTFIKLNYLYGGIFFAIKKCEINYYYDYLNDDYVWNVISQSKTIKNSEYKRMIREEKETNILLMKKVFVNQKNLFDLQYYDFKPDENEITKEEIKQSNLDYLQFYLEQKDFNQFNHDLKNNATLDEMIEHKKSQSDTDFNNQYANIIEKLTNEVTVDEKDANNTNKINDEEFVRKMEEIQSKKSKSKRQNEDLLKQYDNYITKSDSK